MATASLDRVQQRISKKGHQFRPTARYGRVVRAVALAVLAVFLLIIPSGLVLGEVLTQNAHQTALHLEADLSAAITAGIDSTAVRPLQVRLTTIAPPGSWEDPVRAERQLHELAKLHNALEALFAQTLAAERDAFLRTYRRWEDLASQAQDGGLSLQGLNDPVVRLREIAGEAASPAAFRSIAGVVSTYITALADRLTVFAAAKAEANSVLAQAGAALGGATRYGELNLNSLRSQLDAASNDIAAVHMPDDFAAIVGRIRQTEAAVGSLLSSRQAAYATLSATRVALDGARAAGADVSSAAAEIGALEAQLAAAPDETTFARITAQLNQLRQALDGLLVVTIAAPIYAQAMPLDCETSALRIALGFYGFYYTDAQLFAAEPVDLRPPVMGENRAILRWGNPYTHFVGDVNGVAATPTGYGVYYPVIVDLARSHGLPNTIGGEGYSPATIYSELHRQHPVEVWVEYGWTTYQMGVWTAWDGTAVHYSYGEHAVTLTGVTPTQVRVNDPAHGTQFWINKSTFEASWRDFDSMAVIFK